MPLVANRSAAVPSTSAGTTFDSDAPNAGISMATAATSRNTPSASLVDPGGAVSMASPTVNHVPASTAMPVATMPSRDRNPKIDAVPYSGNTNAIITSATV